MWPFDHPLGQCNLSADILYHVTQHIDDMPLDEVAETSASELGKLIHMNERNGQMVKTAARLLPRFRLKCRVQSLSANLLKVQVEAERRFTWDVKAHSNSQAFWLSVADENDISLLRIERILVRSSMAIYRHTFIITIDSLPNQLVVRLMADSWLDSEDVAEVPTASLLLPSLPMPKLPLLDLPLLPATKALKSELPLDFSFLPTTFDAVQTQAFHTLAHASSNALVCVPDIRSRQVFVTLALW